MKTTIVALAIAFAEPAAAQDDGLVEHEFTDAEEVGELRKDGLVCLRRCHTDRRSFIRPRTNLVPELLDSIQAI